LQVDNEVYKPYVTYIRDEHNVPHKVVDLHSRDVGISRDECPKLVKVEVHTDVQETEGEILIHCDIVGVTKELMSITMKGNLLTIEGERKITQATSPPSIEESAQKDNKWHLLERRFGSFKRQFTLPNSVDLTVDPKACMKNGELTITLKKKHSPTNLTKKINVLE
jgi:HSP20 family molecular chaperone IbpA